MASTAVGGAAPAVSIGDVGIMAFVDVDLDFPMGLEQVFPDIGIAEWEPHRTRYPAAFGSDGGWRYRVNCYLVRTSDKTVLVDTGCGPASLAFPAFMGVAGALPARLAAAGIGVDEIDTVLITHVHPDHVGGVLASGSPTPAPAFPRARYLLPRADVETWAQRDVRKGFPIPFVDETVDPLIELGVVDLVGDEQAIGKELTIIQTPGHTPGHSSLLIRSADDMALLAGDVWLHPAQVTEPTWTSAFDMDGAAATRTRTSLAQRIVDGGMTVGACHFPEPFGQLVRLEGRHHWIPLSNS
jgi:glyoxylase-like metal-dependent hydrolase (beta-lactamase superfamily II)